MLLQSATVVYMMYNYTTSFSHPPFRGMVEDVELHHMHYSCRLK
jgi:hypothetical protein